MFNSRRTTVVMSAALLALLAAIYASSHLILMNGFTQLEKQRVDADVQRARETLGAAIADMEAQAADWSNWDDSYDFVSGRNPQYIAKNLPADSFARLRLDFIVYTDRAGKIIYGRTYDAKAQREAPLPAAVLRHMAEHAELTVPPTEGDGGLAGIAVIGNVPALLAARPILTSEGTGPAAGMLIMARYLDAAEVERYAKQLHTRLSLHPLSAQAPHDQALERLNADEVAGSAVLADIYGSPATRLRVVVARDIYHQGLKTTRYFLLCLVVVGAVFLIAAHLMLRRLTRSEAQQQESETRYKAVIQQSGEGIALVERGGEHLVDANASLCTLLGYQAEEIRTIGLDAILARDAEHTSEFLETLLTNGQGVPTQCEFRRKDGSRVDVEVTGNRVSYSGKEVICLAVRDVGERKRDQERIQYLAHFDELTNLPNRTALRDHLQQAIERARKEGTCVGVLILDLDRFKLVNDSLGQHTGDALLQAATKRLKNGVRGKDLVARQGGDEFVIITTDLHSPENCKSAAERVRRALATPFIIAEHELHLTPSIGIAVFPKDGEDVETLIKNADAAMYQAKKAGGNGYRLYAADMNEAGHERLALEAGLRRALERNELSLVYQPQVDLETGVIFGGEALLRWQNPKLGNIPPNKFIPLAEEIGLIIPIGEWVLRTACEQARQWSAAGLPPVRMGVNLSARQLSHPGLAKTIFAMLSQSGLASERLDVEITESMLLTNLNENVRVLRELQDSGITISVDDFGTGYSSLSYLQRLPINTVKIDRSFVQDITSPSSEAPLAKVVIALAQNLKLDVVAEGVETPEQAEFLRRHGCHAVQGYYFSRPVPPAEFALLLQSGRLPAGPAGDRPRRVA